MATAEEGGATTTTTTTTTTSSYGGGAGGKFRKRPFRKPPTPYDRPPVTLRGSNSKGSWLSKLVVDPASKLISYGANRLFASFLHKRLPAPPPPPPQKSELNHTSSGGLPEAVPDSQYGAQKTAGGECGQPIRNSSSNGISELEQLLNEKTFTRSEIDHLTELLHSRAGAVSISDDGKGIQETSLNFQRSQQYDNNLLEAKRNEGQRAHGVVSTPISNSKVLDDGIASPVEVAKTYMDSRPSKASPSMLGERSQITVDDDRLLGNMRISTKTQSTLLTTKTAVRPGSSVNGFIPAPRSRGRSAIYNMARSPYFKGSVVNRNGYAGLTYPSTSLSLVENSEISEPRSMTLKRRSCVLDDEVRSVGPIRRIRQKSNLMSPGISHTDGVGIDSDAAIVASSKKKLRLNGDPKHVPGIVEKITDSNVASRTLERLEKLTPKEKSLELVAVQEKSPFKLTPSMLHGPALRSMEDLRSSELLQNVQDDHEFESRSTDTLLDGHGSSSQEQGKVEDNSPVEYSVPSDTCYPVVNNDSAVSLKASWVSSITSDSVVENGVSQPEYKSAFRMSALEDYVELDDDDDLPSNDPALLPSSEGRGQLEAHSSAGKFSLAREPKIVKTMVQPEVKSPSGFLMSSKTSDSNGAVAGTASMAERSNGITIPGFEGTTAVVQSAVVPPSVAAYDKSKEMNNSYPASSLSSKLADPSLMPEAVSRTPEIVPESSSSLVNIFAPTGSPVKPTAAEDRTGKSDSAPSASSNGPLVLSAPAWSFTAVSSNNTDQISPNGSAIFTPSTSVSTFVSSGKSDITSATSSGNILGASTPPTISGAPTFKFGASLDPFTKVSESSIPIIPAGDLKTNAATNPSSGSSNGCLTNAVPFGIASSGNVSSGFSSSASCTTANSVGIVSLGTSVQPLSFASSTKSSTSTSSLSISQALTPIPSFGINSSAPSSGPGAPISSNGSTYSPFHVNPSPGSDGSAGSSTSVATPSTFSFGFGSLSSSTNAVGSTGGATSSVFSFGLSSSASTSVPNATTPFSTSGTGSSTGPVFSFGATPSVSASHANTTGSFSNGGSSAFSFGATSSAPSSAINSVNRNSAPNPFGSSWQNPKPSGFGSTATSTSPAPGFSFGAPSTAPSSGSPFPFTTSSASGLPSPSPSLAQPVFGTAAPGFAASPGNNYQMNGEDSMAEDPVQSSAPSPVPVFGQSAVSPSPPSFLFGSAVPAQANPFQFNGQQNQVAPQNPSMFQASSSVEFNAGGSFSLGSGGGDKAGRKYVKVNRSKNRKK